MSRKVNVSALAGEAQSEEAKVTSKGQVTIPRGVRRALRAREGDVLVFETDGEGVRRVRVRQPEDVFPDYEGA